tara:strand:- start:713 stop:1030 length:318 start_codon:yes stop_codon:yes gene_type:complete
MSQYENIGIAYFTNPALQNEPFGKEVEGIMISVGKQIPVRKIDTYKEVSMVEEMKPQNLPSLVFTDHSGTERHIYIEGEGLRGITVEKVMDQVAAIDRYNKGEKV